MKLLKAKKISQGQYDVDYKIGSILVTGEISKDHEGMWFAKTVAVQNENVIYEGFDIYASTKREIIESYTLMSQNGTY